MSVFRKGWTYPLLFAASLVATSSSAASGELNRVDTSVQAAGISASETFTVVDDSGRVFLNYRLSVLGVTHERRWDGSSGGCLSPALEIDMPTAKYRVDACSSGIICRAGSRWINFEARRRVMIRPPFVGGMDETISDQEIFGKPGVGYTLGAC